MDPLLPSISTEDYEKLWEKAAELSSFVDQENEMRKAISDMKAEFMKIQIHHAYRTPINTKRLSRKLLTEITLTNNRPEKDKIINITDAVVLNFIRSIIDNRKTLIYRMFEDPKVAQEKATVSILGFLITPAEFYATYCIPAIFGFFSGSSNISDFINALGISFDVAAAKPYKFMKNFRSTFLCSVLRRFFISPHFKRYIGDQYTGFYEHATNIKHSNEQTFRPLMVDFFTDFCNQVKLWTGIWPPFMRALFQRISRKFQGNYKHKIVMLVIIACIFIPLLQMPKIYGALPPSAVGISDLPIDIIYNFCITATEIFNDDPIRPGIVEFERGVVANLVANLLEPTAVGECGPEMETSAAPIEAIVALSQFESDMAAKKAVMDLADSTPKNTILAFPIEIRPRGYSVPASQRMLIELLTATHPQYTPSPTPRLRAIAKTLSLRYFDYGSILNSLSNEIRSCVEFIKELRHEMDLLTDMNDTGQTAITAADTTIITKVVDAMVEENNTNSDFEKRRSVFVNDPSALAQFTVWNVETYLTKNEWATPLAPMIARCLFSRMVLEFPVSVFCGTNDKVDRKLHSRREELLKRVLEKGVDPTTRAIIDCKANFIPAAEAIARMELLRNPVDCARGIAEGLRTIEQLFVFIVGAAPEANQLMPLLATLFLRTPLHRPISFGRWVKAYLQPALELRPEWFSDGEDARIEHFFQLNDWMTHLLGELKEDQQSDHESDSMNSL